METRVIGEVGVDSGQVFITDPCYIKHTKQGNGQWNLDWKEEIVGVDEDGVTEVRRYPVSKNDPTLDNEKNFYTKVCEANGDKGYAEVELGVVMSTTHGDGSYAVEGIFDDDGQFMGIFIDFHGSVEAKFEYKEDEWY